MYELYDFIIGMCLESASSGRLTSLPSPGLGNCSPAYDDGKKMSHGSVVQLDSGRDVECVRAKYMLNPAAYSLHIGDSLLLELSGDVVLAQRPVSATANFSNQPTERKSRHSLARKLIGVDVRQSLPHQD